jgi:serine/threonine protein kinase
VLKAGQRIGKYRIRRRIARGGFADVYKAQDTVEGVDVALKVPSGAHVRPDVMNDFRKEARLAARLEHPNILPLKNADNIDGRFLIVYPLGDESLADRLCRRISLRMALDLAEQILEALAHAHRHRVIHCDVKPENMILFDHGRLRLADFGIAKVAARTIAASASGTIGFMAPEQALGHPSAKSDVFSAGLVIYRMLAGRLPEWPYDWPPPGHERLERLAPELVDVLRRSLELDARRRFRDGEQMLLAFQAAKKGVLRRSTNGIHVLARRKKKNADWRSIRIRQFRRRFGKSFELRQTCSACKQLVDERMEVCPWCSASPLVVSGDTSYPAACPRCERGVKLDWKYCPWCYGSKIGPQSTRHYKDRRYTGKCEACSGKLIAFARYCPWCRAKVQRSWKLGRPASSCDACGHGVLPQFWSSCPWCGKDLEPKRPP